MGGGVVILIVRVLLVARSRSRGRSCRRRVVTGDYITAVGGRSRVAASGGSSRRFPDEIILLQQPLPAQAVLAGRFCVINQLHRTGDAEDFVLVQLVLESWSDRRRGVAGREKNH